MFGGNTMNGTDFIKALDDGLVLVSEDGMYIRKIDGVYMAHTLDYSLFTRGEKLSTDNDRDVYLYNNERAYTVFEAEKFEVKKK